MLDADIGTGNSKMVSGNADTRARLPDEFKSVLQSVATDYRNRLAGLAADVYDLANDFFRRVCAGLGIAIFALSDIMPKFIGGPAVLGGYENATTLTLRQTMLKMLPVVILIVVVFAILGHALI